MIYYNHLFVVVVAVPLLRCYAAVVCLSIVAVAAFVTTGEAAAAAAGPCLQ